MEEAATCCTVETPSQLVLLYPDTTPSTISALLPRQPLCKPVNSRVTLGRSSHADVRLNDERMSRLYAALWHDGKDPFVFRVSNLSERKPLVVDRVVLRQGEEAEVKDGSIITLDFLELKVRVCGGDYTAPFYQVAFFRNALLSPPPYLPSLPTDGNCQLTQPKNVPGFSFGASFPFSTSDDSGNFPSDKPGDNKAGLLARLKYGFKLDEWLCPPCRSVKSMTPSDVGLEYELAKNVVPVSPVESGLHGACSLQSPNNLDSQSEPAEMNSRSFQPLVRTLSESPRRAASTQLHLNIPPPAPQATHHPHNHYQQRRSCACPRPEPLPINLETHKPIADLDLNLQTDRPIAGIRCMNLQTGKPTQEPLPLNLKSDEPISVAGKSHLNEILPLAEIASKIYSSKKVQHEALAPAVLCPCTCGTTTADVTSTLAEAEEPLEGAHALRVLPDMIRARASPVENAEWDTDDPNINCFM